MSCIKNIRLWDDNPDKTRISEVVRIEFHKPREWAILSVEELLTILRLWIIGEEKKYPQSKGFRGRWMLFDKITEVFEQT